jgi:V/A-type H+-transporting ATPase subunit E
METIETGKDKVKKICDVIRKQTLEPAMEEAESIVERAKKEAEAIVKQAEEKAQKMLAEGGREVEKRKAVFEASMQQAAVQMVETLKQKVKDHLFSAHLSKLLHTKLNEPEVLSSLIKALIEGIKKEGTQGDISAYISAVVPPEKVNALLGKALLDELKEKSVLIGPMKAGCELQLHKDQVTVSITDETLKELIARYIRKDLREFLFGI